MLTDLGMQIHGLSGLGFRVPYGLGTHVVQLQTHGCTFVTGPLLEPPLSLHVSA
jgi:hypothetical protein